MNHVYRTETIRALEKGWADSHKGSTWALMAAAAESFSQHFMTLFLSKAVLIVVGKGNNGGDGYCIAALLKNAGIEVTVWQALGEPNKNSDAFKARAEYLKCAGIEILEPPNSDFDFDIVIDAIFGIGLSRSLDQQTIEIIQFINDLPNVKISVDVPSGLNADTGLAIPLSIKAHYTHTFIGLKPGLVTAQGPFLCGILSCDSLNLNARSSMEFRIESNVLPQRESDTYKTRHGDVRIIGGANGMGGAAIIAAQSALNTGAGRVYLHCDSNHHNAALVRAPELMVQDLSVESMSDNRQKQQTTNLGSKDTFVVGPGLGDSNAVCNILELLVTSTQKYKGVFDADALRWLAENPQTASNWILTPHTGEAAALLGVDNEYVVQDRLTAAINLANKYDTVVVLKGAGTIVANRTNIVFCHPGHPAMATAGMGDCLAGIIGSLIAQGLNFFDSAVSGVNLHGQLGWQLGQKQRVVLASDIIKKLKDRT